MRILYLITRAERGGAQSHVLDLLHGLRAQHELALAAGEEGFLTAEARTLGIPVRILPHLVQPLQPASDARALREALSAVKEFRPHLLHAHTSKAGIIGRLAAAFTGVPAVFTAHTWCFAEGTSWKWKAVGIPLERIASAASRRIIAVSEANRRSALDWRVAPAERVITIHNGIPDTPLRACADRTGVPRVVMVARCAPQKDHATLLRAAAALERPFELWVVGGGPLRPALEAEARALGLGGKVWFAGDRENVAGILAQAHVFVLATHWEGFPISILEAMRAGLPVIASDAGGVREAVNDGSTGFVVPRGDVAALHSRLAFLLGAPDCRSRMGAAGRRAYERRFQLSIMLERTAAVYAEAVRERAGAWDAEGQRVETQFIPEGRP